MTEQAENVIEKLPEITSVSVSTKGLRVLKHLVNNEGTIPECTLNGINMRFLQVQSACDDLKGIIEEEPSKCDSVLLEVLGGIEEKLGEVYGTIADAVEEIEGLNNTIRDIFVMEEMEEDELKAFWNDDWNTDAFWKGV